MAATIASCLIDLTSGRIGRRLNDLKLFEKGGLVCPLGDSKRCFEEVLQNRRVGSRFESLLFTKDLVAAYQELVGA